MHMWFITTSMLAEEKLVCSQRFIPCIWFLCRLDCSFLLLLVLLCMGLLEESCSSSDHLVAEGPGLYLLNFPDLAWRGGGAVRNCREAGQL